ncbi:MAG TPA: glycosyltransferase family 39 protein [Candidatus Dormibacteraeota bacterium]|nr:glycosyltransferase family 39 protein [Candidatus Dormibacteraeota bacterium]
MTISTPLAAESSGTLALNQKRVIILGLAAICSMLVLNTFCRVFYTGDEAFYSVTALNMLHSPTYILRPSFFPDGDFLADKDGYAQPPLNSYFLAIPLWLSGGVIASQEIVNVLAFALLLYCGYRLLSLFDSQAAGLAVLLLATSPMIVFCYGILEAEPVMTTFGIAALYLAFRGGFQRGQKRWLYAGAICIGFAFALKLWLSGPLALAVLVALVVRASQAQIKLRWKALHLVLFGLVALIPAATHILAVACTYPQDLPFWFKNIYFGVFTSSGISGTKMTGEGIDSNWIHPFWYYGPLLYRDHFFLAPIFLFGIGSILRDKSVKRELLCALLAGAGGLVVLSGIKVKEFLYVLTCVTFIYLLAAVVLASLLRRLAQDGEVDPFSRRLGYFGTSGLIAVFLAAYALHIQPDKITRGFIIGHTVTQLLILSFFWWATHHRGLRLQRVLYAAAAAFVAVAFCYRAYTRQPRDKMISNIIQPYVQNNSPQALSLIGSNFRSFQFFTFRRGCYWQEVPLAEGPEKIMAKPEYRSVHAFIIDLKEETKPEISAWVRWLESHATEKTGELDSHLRSPSDFRIFVR